MAEISTQSCTQGKGGTENPHRRIKDHDPAVFLRKAENPFPVADEFRQRAVFDMLDDGLHRVALKKTVQARVFLFFHRCPASFPRRALKAPPAYPETGIKSPIFILPHPPFYFYCFFIGIDPVLRRLSCFGRSSMSLSATFSSSGDISWENRKIYYANPIDFSPGSMVIYVCERAEASFLSLSATYDCQYGEDDLP